MYQFIEKEIRDGVSYTLKEIWQIYSDVFFILYVLVKDFQSIFKKKCLKKFCGSCAYKESNVHQ